MKIGNKEVKEIVIKDTTGELIADITDDDIISENNIIVELVSPTYVFTDSGEITKMEKTSKETVLETLSNYLDKITDTSDGLITPEHIASVPAVAEAITKLLSL